MIGAARFLNLGELLRSQFRGIEEVRYVETKCEISALTYFFEMIEIFEISASAVDASQPDPVRLLYSFAQSVEAFFASGLGRRFSNQVSCRFLESARGFTIRVAHNFAIGWIGRRAGDTRHFKRLGVGPRTVAIERHEIDRSVRNNCIQDLLIRQPGRRKGGISPPHPQDPLLLGMRIR